MGKLSQTISSVKILGKERGIFYDEMALKSSDYSPVIRVPLNSAIVQV